jgi:glycine C-acetyltransferase
VSANFLEHNRGLLNQIARDGLFKDESLLTSAQGGRIYLSDDRGNSFINLCSNNYLGLANHPDIVEAAKRALDASGFGMASVRFICGTQTLHRDLEKSIAGYLRKDDAILFGSCFDANGGLFEALLGEEDAIISDALNHASIIDGIRLCKAKRYRYANGDMDELETCLKEAHKSGARFKMVATDGIFSMDGYIADLPNICRLAKLHDAVVMVDDSHATGHIGEAGRGTPSLTGVSEHVEIITGTFGKSLGGAMGGFVAASQPVVDVLRQKSRPYLFSNSLAPAIVAGTLKAIQLAQQGESRREKLRVHAARFRSSLTAAGFALLPGSAPIVPIMLNDAQLALAMASALRNRGVHVAAFSYPVVPQGKARIRTQLSAALTEEDLDIATDAFESAGRKIGII